MVKNVEMGHPADRPTIIYDELNTQAEVENTIPAESTVFYTDGSKRGNHVSAAWIKIRGNPNDEDSIIDKQKYKLGTECEAFQAELLAIEQALLSTEECTNQTYHLCTDSRQTLEMLTNNLSKLPLVQRIRNRLKTAEELNNSWHFHWTKGHQDVIGNKIVDKLAKQRHSDEEEEKYSDMSRRTVKKYMSKATRDKWQDDYLSTSKGKITKEYVPNIETASLLFQVAPPNFYSTQILTGHGATMHYFYRFKISNTDSCSCSPNTPQTVKHLIEHCSLFNRERNQLRERMKHYKTEAEKLADRVNVATEIMKKIYSINNSRLNAT